MTNKARVPAMLAAGTGEVASAVRSRPWTIQGWRPLSVTTQPAITATKPIHQHCAMTRRYQFVSNSVPRHHRKAPSSAAAIMKKPTPNMIRKPKNTIFTGGRSDAGTLFKPGNSPFMRWVRISEAAFGIEIAKRLMPACSSGQANISKLAGRTGGHQPLRDFDPEGGLADPHPPHERAVPRLEQRAGVGAAAGVDRVLRFPYHVGRRLLHDRGGAARRLPVVARHAVRNKLVPSRHGAMLVDRFRRGDRRLGGDRERPPALDRRRPAAHRRRHLAGAGRQHRRYPRFVRRRLRRRVLVRHLLHLSLIHI